MTFRFCPRCANEVEDVGGFCLLGHPLKLDPLIPSVAEIRDVVDRAVDEAHTSSSSSPRESSSTGAPPPPPAATLYDRHTVWESLETDADLPGDPIEAFAPPPRMDWGPDARPGLIARSRRRREPSAPA